MLDYEFSQGDVRIYDRMAKEDQAKIDELELEVGMLKQAYEDLKRAIPVQALTVFLDWWEDPDYNDIPSYDDFMAVAALLDRVREM